MATAFVHPNLTQFREANDLLGNFTALQSRFDEDGYLFLRKILKPEEVQAVKQSFIQALQRQGAVRAGTTEALWTGVGVDGIDEFELYAQPTTSALLESAHTHQFMESVFRAPIYMFKSYNIRYALPNDPQFVTPPHQDYFFIRINENFRTLWIPLMDIDEEVGGLVLGGGSHKRGMLDHIETDAVFSYVFKGRKQRGIPLESIPQPWLTTDYHAGDVLIFNSLMIHWALPNRSDRIRLSIDTRCQPATAPRTWQAEMPILEARRVRETSKKIAEEEGASPAQFENILIELMKRGWEPSRENIRENIKTLMAEVS